MLIRALDSYTRSRPLPPHIQLQPTPQILRRHEKDAERRHVWSWGGGGVRNGL